MGFGTDIFTSEPAASCICAICHDVLKDASALNCGHTFCEECIASVLEREVERNDPKCPNCRANITDHKPNYTVKDLINGLTVRCPDGGTECNWTGRVDALEVHGSTCIYKTIECDVEGCNHTCQRKDMADHLSDTDVKLRHMELKYDKKLKDMEAKYERKFAECQNKIQEYETRLQVVEVRTRADNLIAEARNTTIVVAPRRRVRDEGEGTQRNVRARQSRGDEFVVEGCGIDAINGIYSRDGGNDNAPKYVRRAQYNGREEEFSLFRYRVFGSAQQSSMWYISIIRGHRPSSSGDDDFYFASSHDSLPPANGWLCLRLK